MPSTVALANKGLQTFTWIGFKVPNECQAESIIGTLLEDLARKTRAKVEEFLHHISRMPNEMIRLMSPESGTEDVENVLR